MTRLCSPLFRPCSLERFETYDAQLAAPIRLDLSTNPLGPSPRALEAVRSTPLEELQHYPECQELPELKGAIARFTDLSPANVLLTAGAYPAFEIALSHLLNPGDPIAIHIPTFPLFELVARNLCDARPLLFTDLDAIPEAKVLVLCTPNNPTTAEVPRDRIIELLESRPRTMVIVDNVFAEFSDDRLEPLVSRFPNLILLRSFSKAFGLAGLRIGFALSSAENIAALSNGISPFRVPLLAQRAALAALEDRAHLERTRAFLRTEFARIREALGDATARHANLPFFLLDAGDSVRFCSVLLSKGIAVTDASSFKGLPARFARVAIGAREANDCFIAAALEALEEMRR